MLGGREHARHHKHAHNSVFVVFEMRRRRGGHIRHQNRHFYCPPQDLIRSGQNFQIKFASYCQPNWSEIF